MKRQVVAGVVGFALMTVIAVPAVYAQQQSTPGSAGGNAGNPSTMAEEMKARILERKTRLQTQVPNTEAAKIRDSCVASQSKIGEVGKKFNDAVQPVMTTHNSRIGNLQRLNQYAQTKNINTEDYMLLVNQYAESHQSFVAAVNSFNLSMSDLKGIDCVNDVTGFRATLQSARNESEQIKKLQPTLDTQSAAIKPTLEKLKADFEK